jgi:hypothetical protein
MHVNAVLVHPGTRSEATAALGAVTATESASASKVASLILLSFIQVELTSAHAGRLIHVPVDASKDA